MREECSQKGSNQYGQVSPNNSSRHNSCLSCILHWFRAIWASFKQKPRDIKSSKNPRCIEQELEGAVNPTADSPLSPNLWVSGKPKDNNIARRDKAGQGRTPVTTTYAATPVEWRAPVMAVVTLLPRYYVKVPVNVHAKLFTIFSNVTIQLEAEHTVDVFVIDDNGLKAFESGQPYFWRYYNQPNVSALTISLSLPIPQGQLAWVVIQSKEHQYTALYYNVS